MRRGIAVSWHALSFLLAAVLYFFFVLPRWWELMGDVSHGLGTGMRIVTGALIALTALPVVINLIGTRKPEYGTPALALTLRVWSIVGHVLAGILIIGTAVAEIWVSLDDAGQWLFGVYGAAAALAVLGAAAFYLAFVAELPPPPPKPLKSKPAKKSTQTEDAAVPVASADAADEKPADEPADAEPAEVTAEETPVDGTEVDSTDTDTATDTDTDDSTPATTGGRLRNRRPSGKTGGANVKRRRSSGGVAVSDD